MAYDIEILKAIEAKEIDTKTFDFDGQKYSRKEASTIQAKLEKELDELKQTLVHLDKTIFSFFYSRVLEVSIVKATSFKQSYSTYFEHRKEADVYVNLLNTIMNLLHPVFAGQTLGLEEIENRISTLKSRDEGPFKDHLKNWLSLGVLDQDASLKEKTEIFINKDYQYLAGNSFFENELKELDEIVHQSWEQVQIFLFNEFKAILEMQVEIIESLKTNVAV